MIWSQVKNLGSLGDSSKWESHGALPRFPIECLGNPQVMPG